MVNKKIKLAMMALVLLFGMMLIACDDEPSGRFGNFDGPGSSGANTSLNGTWVTYDETLNLNNGIFTMSIEGFPYMRGSYTTSGSSMTVTPTEVHSNIFMGEFPISSGWYTRSQLMSAIENVLRDMMPPWEQAYLPYYMAEYNEEMNEFFTPMTGFYSLSGNILTITMDGETTIFTRQ